MPASLEKLIMNACDLPAVPDVAQKVMKLMSDPNCNATKIGRTISGDQALTARILKISNSAFYGCLRTINSLQSAIVIVGQSAIRSLVVAVSTKEVYKNFGLTERMLWEHSVGSGIAAHILAKEARISKGDDVFVCGLLHDVGKVVMNNSKRDLYQEVMEKIYNENVPAIEAEQEIFGFNHAEVGALVVKKWNLTEELEKAVKFHHDVSKLSNEDRYIYLLACIVHMADLLCHKLGIGAREPDESVEVKGTEAGEAIGLTEERIDELLVQVAKSYEEEKNIFE